MVTSRAGSRVLQLVASMVAWSELTVNDAAIMD